MPVVLVVAGVVLLLVLARDVVSTTLDTDSGAGPVTSLIATRWWRLAHRMAHGPRSRWMAISGPTVLLLTVAAWLLLLWGGWSLIFLSDLDAVVSATTGEPADAWSRVYYAAFSVFTLGVGDYVPSSAPWQVVTSFTVISGLGLTTMAITYLVPVVNAVTARRVQASTICGLGATPQEIVVGAHRGDGFAFLDHQLLPLSTSLLETAESHLAYPVLHYFHSGQRHVDLRVQLYNLDEAITLLKFGVEPDAAPHPGVLGSVRHATTELIGRVAPVAPVDTAPPPPDLEPLRRAGIATVDDATFAQHVESLADHRCRMVAYAQESLWERPGDADVDVGTSEQDAD